MNLKKIVFRIFRLFLIITTFILTTILVCNQNFMYLPIIKKANYKEEILLTKPIIKEEIVSTEIFKEEIVPTETFIEEIVPTETFIEVCLHENVNVITLKEATCTETGVEATICEICNITIGEHFLELKACSYEEKWIYVKYATPVERGERYKQCSSCGGHLSEFYTDPMPGENSIYITGTDIKACFTISSFSQNAVDKYDVVYTEDTQLGANNPFVLGHNYGTLSKLNQTKVGEYIYLSNKGTIETYKVVVSEYGLQNSDWTDIIGQTTGTSIWHNYGCKTLHIYSCYGSQKNGRWMVLATKVS